MASSKSFRSDSKSLRNSLGSKSFRSSLVRYAGYEDRDEAAAEARWGSKTPAEKSEFARQLANARWRKSKAQKRIAELIDEAQGHLK